MEIEEDIIEKNFIDNNDNNFTLFSLEEIKEYVENKKQGQEKNNILNIDFSKNNLKKLPKYICDLKELKSLKISFNPIKSLPKSIGNLSNLKLLVLNNNQLISLPEEIGELKNLEELRVACNPITEIPESIGNLTELISLYLDDNELISLPESIGDLKNLTTLDLSNNKLISLPDSIGNFKKLEILNLNDNPLFDELSVDTIIKKLPYSFINILEKHINNSLFIVSHLTEDNIQYIYDQLPNVKKVDNIKRLMKHYSYFNNVLNYDEPIMKKTKTEKIIPPAPPKGGLKRQKTNKNKKRQKTKRKTNKNKKRQKTNKIYI